MRKDEVSITKGSDPHDKNFEKDSEIYRDGMKSDILTSAIAGDFFSSDIKVTERDGVYLMRTL